jgi:hypothetical protein
MKIAPKTLEEAIKDGVEDYCTKESREAGECESVIGRHVRMFLAQKFQFLYLMAARSTSTALQTVHQVWEDLTGEKRK